VATLALGGGYAGFVAGGRRVRTEDRGAAKGACDCEMLADVRFSRVNELTEIRRVHPEKQARRRAVGRGGPAARDQVEAGARWAGEVVAGGAGRGGRAPGGGGDRVRGEGRGGGRGVEMGSARRGCGGARRGCGGARRWRGCGGGRTQRGCGGG
jgi:hypothetical protein